MATQRIGLRHDTDANWASNDPSLLTDETVVVDDQRKLIRGDGNTYNTSYDYVGHLSGWNNLTTVTSNHTIAVDDEVVEADTSGGSFTITLPDRSTYQGRTLVIRKVASANNAKIDRAGTDAISASALTTISLLDDGDYIELFAGSTRWEIVEGVGKDAGDMVPYGGSGARRGTLECDGSAVSRTTYSALFAEIGTTWGAGDGSTTFNVPDMRGLSPEGTGTNGSAQDAAGNNYSGASLGAVKNDQMQGHRHEILSNGRFSSEIEAYGPTQNTSDTEYIPSASGSDQTRNNMTNDPGDDGTNGTPRTGTYTTGPRAGVTYCIRY